jgi:hypothetical protein
MPIIDTLEKFNALPIESFYPVSIEDIKPGEIYFIRCQISEQLLPFESELAPGAIDWYFSWREVEFSTRAIHGNCGMFERPSDSRFGRIQLKNRNQVGFTALCERRKYQERIDAGMIIPVTLTS